MRTRHLPILLLLMRWGVRPFGITCAGKKDGGGSQTHSIMSVIAFCSFHKIKYFHTPIQVIGHRGDDCGPNEWEATFDLGATYDRAIDSNIPIISALRFALSPWRWFLRTIVVVPAAFQFIERNISYYDHMIELFRTSFNGHPVRHDAKTLDVFLHARRGDVSELAHSRSFTSNEKIVRRVRLIKSILIQNGVAFRFTVFSEGKPEDFPEIIEEGCELALNKTSLDTLKQLSQADILIMGKSSFSYVAALINPNLVFYEPFWHNPRSDWINVDDPEMLSKAVLKKALSFTHKPRGNA